MAIIRVPKQNNYSVIDNRHLRDRAISMKAKGLMDYMLTRPDDWDFSIAGLVACLPDGRRAIASALRELEDAGYLERIIQRDDKGRYKDMEYKLSEVAAPQARFRPTDNRPAENPPAENDKQPNKDKANTEKTNDDDEAAPQESIIDVAYISRIASLIYDGHITGIGSINVIATDRQAIASLTAKDYTTMAGAISSAVRNGYQINRPQMYTAMVILRYVRQRPKPAAKKNSLDQYNSFMHNDYDFEALEKALLG